MLSVLTWQIRKLPILSSILKILNKSIILSIWRKCRPFLAFFVLQEFAEIPCIIGTVWPNGPCCERKQKPDRSINLENDAPTLPPHQSVAWVPDRRHKDNAALTFLPRKGLMGEGANSYGLLPPDQRHLMWSKLFTLLLSLSSVPCLARVHHHVQRLRHTGGKYVGSGQSPKSGPVLGRDLLAEIHHSFQWLPPPCSKKNSKI